MFPTTNRRVTARFFRAGAVMTWAALGGLAGGAHAAPYGFTTGLEVGGAWYDHLSSVQGSSQFTGRSFAPEIGYRAETPTQRMLVSLRRGYTYYRGTPVDSLVRSGPQTIDRALLSFERRGPTPNAFSVGGSYERSRDVLDLTDRILVNPADALRWTGNSALTLPFAEGSVVGRGWYYANSDLTSAISLRAGARAVPLRGAVTALFGGWDERMLMLGRSVVMRSYLAGAGVRRQVSPWLTAEVEGGMSGVTWADGASASGPAGRFKVETHGEVAPIVSLEVEARRDLPSTIAAEIGSRLPDGSVRLRGSWEPDVEGGFVRAPEQAARLALVAEDTLGRANVVGGEVSYAHLSPLHFEGPRVETLHASAWALRRLRPWLSARIGGAFVRQPVRAIDEPVFRRMRFDLALIVRVPGQGATGSAW